MFNLNYDDLKQRHKLRKLKKIIVASTITAAISFAFLLNASIMLIKINSQQKVLKRHQALSLASKARKYLNKDSRYSAIKASYQALTKFNGVKMPYTPEAEYALSESLGVYDSGLSYKAVDEVKTKGVVTYIKTSEDNKYFAVYDGSEEINIYNSKTMNKISTYSVAGISYYESSFGFVGNDILSFINKKGNISLVDVKKGNLVKEIKKEKDSYYSLKGDSNGKYLIYTDNNKLYIYNIKNNKTIESISSKNRFMKEMYYSDNGEYIFVGTTKNALEFDKDDFIDMHVIETKNGEEINSKVFEAGYINGIITKGDNAYFLLNNMVDSDFNILVVSYNYIDGDVNWSKTYEDSWGKFINKSYPKDTNNIAVASYDTVKVINAANGESVETFNTKGEIINIYSYLNKEIYLVFTNKGSVNYINMKYKNNVEYLGEFEFNVKNYSNVVQSNNGFLLVPKNDNRVILYEKNTNKELKEVKIKDAEIKDNSVQLNEYDKLIKKYNIKNKDLVNRIFYDNKKKLMFVNYTNKDIAIYNVKDKKLLKKLNNVGTIRYYFGKDKYDRIYIGDISDTYILNKNYDKVGHVVGLFKLDKDKIIINNSNGFYEIKIYTLDELKKEAQEYLK